MLCCKGSQVTSHTQSCLAARARTVMETPLHSKIQISFTCPGYGLWTAPLKGIAHAEGTEGQEFLWELSSCIQNSSAGISCVEAAVLQSWNGGSFWMQEAPSTKICAELITQTQKHPPSLGHCYGLLYRFLQCPPFCWYWFTENSLLRVR